MSVKMAVAKLCACACGGAVIGGGAVHVADRPARIHYAKARQAKPPKRVAVHKPQPARGIRSKATGVPCVPDRATAYAARPVFPLPADPAFAGNSGFGDPAGAQGLPVIMAGTGGFGGGYYTNLPGGGSGGRFGGTGAAGTISGGTSPSTGGSGPASGGDDATAPSSTGSTPASQGSTSLPTGGGSTPISGGDTSTPSSGAGPSSSDSGGGAQSSTGGGTSTSASGGSGGGGAPGAGGGRSTSISSGSGGENGSGNVPPSDPPGATPVPAPPMLVLFGAAAAALIARRQLAGRKSRE